jgi:hypothetical protein
VIRVDAGAVTVVRGSSTGLSLTGVQFWTQDSGGVPGAVEASDAFGAVLAAGDFNGVGFRDLAIGVPGEDLTDVDAGGVNVIYGSPFGLSPIFAETAQFWSQDSTGIAGGGEAGDRFGSALTAWDYGRSPETDLVIGVPFEDLVDDGGNPAPDAGAVNVIYGSGTGLTSTGNHMLSQGANGVGGDRFPGNRFGTALY